MNRYEYNGPDDDILDEDKVGKRSFDIDDVISNKAILAFAFAAISLILALMRFSGILAIVFGLLATSTSAKILRIEPDNSLAKASRIMGLIGLILGVIFFVTCISCASCLGCGIGRYYNEGIWRTF